MTYRMAVLLAVSAAGAAAQGPTDVYLLQLERDGDRVVVAGVAVGVTDRAGYDNQPLFTADGRALLYTSIRDGQADSYRYELASRRTTRLTRTPESEYSPTPIPGSDRFSVVRVEADGTQRLWSFAADGSDPRLLLPGVAPVGYHAWLGPGRVALYILGEPATLQIADLATGEARVRAAGIGRAIQPVPGRTAVTFTQEADGDWWLRSLDTGTGEVRSVARLLGADEYHAHTPGGATLTAHGTRLYQLHEGGDWQPVAELSPQGLGELTRLAISPDGRWLAVVADRP